MKLKASGMIHIILACIGSGGVGFSQTWNRLDSVIRMGSTKNGSLADRSVIHRIHGA